jgi:hypothetical protein
MARKVNPELQEDWRARLKRQQASGLTVAEFCRQEGVSAGSFFAWKRKLLDPPPAGPRQKADQSRDGRPQKASGSKPRHDQPEVAFVQLPLAPARSAPWIELVLVEGTIIRLPQQNVTALETVLRTLRGGPACARPEETRYA